MIVGVKGAENTADSDTVVSLQPNLYRVNNFTDLC